eukprot:TRINITY_DN11657_c0_g1_i1.p1 TRINITY_DN11657_c0_g1~~TRINITY_DN11657_c0_g1_i1.p1  ORF type:complete len:3169 (-),score=588.83 TRINITY_DN11657_c0_g1_i1:265-9771(-)
MLQKIVSAALEGILSDYFDGFDAESFKVGLWKGDVTLENVFLKQNALSELGLPMRIERGWVGTITARIPWKSLQSKPAKITVDKLYILLSPRNPRGDWDTLSEETIWARKKRSIIQNSEHMNPDRMEPNSQKDDSSSEALIRRLMEKADLEINTMHVMYLDTFSRTEHCIYGGFRIKSIRFLHTDENWKPCHHSQESSDILYKLLECKDISAYLYDTSIEISIARRNFSALNGPSLAQLMDSQMATIKNPILKDIDAIAKICMTPTNSLNPTAALTVDIVLEKFGANIQDYHFVDICTIKTFFENFYRRFQYRRLRPNIPVKQGIIAWWRFAYNATVDRLQSNRHSLCWAKMQQKCRERRQYFNALTVISQFTSKKQSNSNIDQLREAEAELRRLEAQLHVQDIIFLRALWEDYVRDRCGPTESKSPSRRPKAINKFLNFKSSFLSKIKSRLPDPSEIDAESNPPVIDSVQPPKLPTTSIKSWLIRVCIPKGSISLYTSKLQTTSHILETKFDDLVISMGDSGVKYTYAVSLAQLHIHDIQKREARVDDQILCAPGAPGSPFFLLLYEQESEKRPGSHRLSWNMDRMDIQHSVGVMSSIQEIRRKCPGLQFFDKTPIYSLDRPFSKFLQPILDLVSRNRDLEINAKIASSRILLPQSMSPAGEGTIVVICPGDANVQSLRSTELCPECTISISVSSTQIVVLNAKDDWKSSDLSTRSTKIIDRFDWCARLKYATNDNLPWSPSVDISMPTVSVSIWPSKLETLTSFLRSFDLDAHVELQAKGACKQEGYLKIRRNRINHWSWKWIVMTEKSLYFYTSSTKTKLLQTVRLRDFARFDVCDGPSGFVCFQLTSSYPLLADDILFLCPSLEASWWTKSFHDVGLQAIRDPLFDGVPSLQLSHPTFKSEASQTSYRWTVGVERFIICVQEQYRAQSNHIRLESSNIRMSGCHKGPSREARLEICSMIVRDFIQGTFATLIDASANIAKDEGDPDGNQSALIWDLAWSVAGNLAPKPALVSSVFVDRIHFWLNPKSLFLVQELKRQFGLSVDTTDKKGTGNTLPTMNLFRNMMESYDIEHVSIPGTSFDPYLSCRKCIFTVGDLSMSLTDDREIAPWFRVQMSRWEIQIVQSYRTVEWTITAQSCRATHASISLRDFDQDSQETIVFDGAKGNVDGSFLRLCFKSFSREVAFQGLDSHLSFVVGNVRFAWSPDLATRILQYLDRYPQRPKFENTSYSQRSFWFNLNHLIQIEGDTRKVVAELPEEITGTEFLAVLSKKSSFSTPKIRLGIDKLEMNVKCLLSAQAHNLDSCSNIWDDTEVSISITETFKDQQRSILITCDQINNRLCEFHIPLLKRILITNYAQYKAQTKALRKSKKSSDKSSSSSKDENLQPDPKLHILLKAKDTSIVLHYLSNPLVAVELQDVEIKYAKVAKRDYSLQLGISSLSMYDLREKTHERYRRILVPRSQLSQTSQAPSPALGFDASSYNLQFYFQVQSHPIEGLDIVGSLQNLQLLVVPDILKPLTAFMEFGPRQEENLDSQAPGSPTLLSDSWMGGNVFVSSDIHLTSDLILGENRTLHATIDEENFTNEIVINGRNHVIELRPSSLPLIYVPPGIILRLENVKVLHSQPLQDHVCLGEGSEIVLDPLDGVTVEKLPMNQGTTSDLSPSMSGERTTFLPGSSIPIPSFHEVNHAAMHAKDAGGFSNGTNSTRKDKKKRTLKWRIVVVQPQFRIPGCSTSGSCSVLSVRLNAILSGRYDGEFQSFRFMVQEISPELCRNISMPQGVSLLEPFNVFIDFDSAISLEDGPACNVEISSLVSSLSIEEIKSLAVYVENVRDNYHKASLVGNDSRVSIIHQILVNLPKMIDLDVSLQNISVMIRRRCYGVDIPLLRIPFTETEISYKGANHGRWQMSSNLSVDLFQESISDWEPLLEPWPFDIEMSTLVDESSTARGRFDMSWTSGATLNVNISPRILDTISLFRSAWNCPLAIQLPDNEPNISYPYWIQNMTGCILHYWAKSEELPCAINPGERVPILPWIVDTSSGSYIYIDENAGPEVYVKIAEEYNITSLITRIPLACQGIFYLDQATMNGEHVDVIVDVVNEGEIRLLKIRSSITITNMISFPLEVLAESPNIAPIVLGPMVNEDSVSVPIQNVKDGIIYFRPSPAYLWCSNPPGIELGSLSTSSTIITCLPMQSSNNAPVCFVLDAEYVESSLSYSLKVKPILVVENLLASDVVLHLSVGRAEPHIRAELSQGDSFSHYQIEPHKESYMTISMDGWKQQEYVLLYEPGMGAGERDIMMMDEKGDILVLKLEVCEAGTRSYHCILYNTFWIENKTDQPLFYRQHSSARGLTYAAAGLPVDGHSPFAAPFMFSTYRADLYGGRLSLCSSSTKWCEPFSLETAGASGSVVASLSKERGQVEWAVKISRAQGKYNRTLVVTVAPKYVVLNHLDYPVEIKFKFSSDSITVDPGQESPLNYVGLDKKIIIQLRKASENWEWSPGFLVSPSSDFLLITRRKGQSFVSVTRVQMILDLATVRIMLKQPSGIPMYRIVNQTRFTIIYRQKNTSNWSSLLPRSSAEYIWPEPIEDHLLQLFADGYEAHKTIDLDNVNSSFVLSLIHEKMPAAQIFITVVAEGPTKVLRLSENIYEASKDAAVKLTQNLAFSLNLSLKAVGVSFISASLEELSYLTLSRVDVLIGKSSDMKQLEIKIGEIQMDDQRNSAIYPTILWVRKLHGHALHLVGIQSMAYTDIQYYQYISALFQELVVSFDTRIIFELYHLFKGRTKARELDVEDVMGVPSIGDIFLEVLHLHPIRLSLSYHPNTSPYEKMYHELGNLVKIAYRIGNAPVKLNALVLENPFDGPKSIFRRVRQHYKRQLVVGLYKLFGSVDLLENPFGSHMTHGNGMFDFFYEPALGIVKGPEAFAKGLARGTMSLIRNSIHGAFGSNSGLASSFGLGTSTEAEYDTDRLSAARVSRVRFGTQELPTGRPQSVKKEKEREQAESSSSNAGVIDLASKPSSSSGRFSVTSLMKPPMPARDPRLMSFDGRLRPYSAFQAQGQRYLCNLLKERHVNEHYVGHDYLDGQGRICFVTNRSIILTKKNGDEVDKIVALRDISSIDLASSDTLVLNKSAANLPSSTRITQQFNTVIIRCPNSAQSLLHIYRTIMLAIQSYIKDAV